MLHVERKKVFKELKGEILSERVIPHAEESKKFWEEMWGNDEEDKREAAWLEEFMVMAAWLSQTMVSSAEDI